MKHTYVKQGILSVLSVLALITCFGCTQKEPAASQTTDTQKPETQTAAPETDPTEPGVYTSIDPNIDFILNVPEGHDIKIVQLTDTQITHYESARSTIRKNQIKGAFFSNGVTDDEIKTYRYIDEAVAMGNPDLIVITGDLIYGETDDSGEIWSALVKRMDTYKIPWAVVFGNHDNESAKGVLWQIEQLKNSEYCVFSQGSVTGNCNYNIALKQGGKLKYLLYMLDTNGCKEIDNNGEGILADNVDIKLIQQKQGIYADQIKWYTDTATAIRTGDNANVPCLAFFHIAVQKFNDACYDKYNYKGSGTLITNKDGDFGKVLEFYDDGCVDQDNKFFDAAKAVGTVGMFFGHDHIDNASIFYDGVRLTYGMKTGTHSYSNVKLLGSTLITISEATNDFVVSLQQSQYKDSN